MMKRSLSKLALVTGGGSGIGHAISEKLQQNGIQVIVADKRTENKDNTGVSYRKCDVSKSKEVEELFEWTTKNFGHPDILVLNAGQGIQEKITEGDPEKWNEVIQTNLMGPLRCSRAFIPHMLKVKKGYVIFISSVSAFHPHPFGGIYVATKTALEVIAETLRQETSPDLKVTVISPGVVNTPFLNNEFSDRKKEDLKDMGSIPPEEIADDVWYVLNKKKGTGINKIVTRPVLQNF